MFFGAVDEARGLLDRLDQVLARHPDAWVDAHARVARAQLALADGDLVAATSLLDDAVGAVRAVDNPFTLITYRREAAGGRRRRRSASPLPARSR